MYKAGENGVTGVTQHLYISDFTLYFFLTQGDAKKNNGVTLASPKVGLIYITPAPPCRSGTSSVLGVAIFFFGAGVFDFENPLFMNPLRLDFDPFST